MTLMNSDHSGAVSWDSLRSDLWTLISVLVPYSPATDSYSVFPDAAENVLRAKGVERSLGAQLRVVGEELVRLSDGQDQLPRLQVRQALWVFTALLTIPASVTGHEQAAELAWTWHDKVDEAWGRASVTG